MKKYQSYRPSRVEWIGDIPEHWEVKRLKYISEIENSGIWGEDEPFENSYHVPIPTTGQLSIEGDWYYEKMNFRHLTKDEWEKYKCIKGDIIVVKSSGSSTNIITGKCGFIDENDNEKFGFSNFLLRVRPQTINPKLLYYFLQSNITKQRIERMVSSTTYPNLKVDEYSNSIIICPNPKEEQQIVQFLDEKTEIIGKLISTKERKIELLTEERTSLINRIITKGIYPNVRKKQSGIEVIGEIPEHWKLVYLRHYTKKIGSGVTPKGGGETYVDEGVIFVRSQNVYYDGLRLDDVVKISEEVHNNMSSSKVKNEDVLLNITGGSIGRCCVVSTNKEMNVNQHVCIIRPKESLSSFFLNYYLQSSIGQFFIEYFISGGNREGLTFESIKCFRIPLPSLHEQTEIVKYLNIHINEMDDLVTMEKRKIDLLKEYRQSLISDVITGKIDVRTNVN